MRKNPYFKSEEHLKNIQKASKKAKEAIQKKVKEKKDAYYENPKCCLQCHLPIPYEKKNENKYCSSKCRAQQINPTKGKKRTESEKNKISIALGGDGTTKRKPKIIGNENLSRSEIAKKHHAENPETRQKISKTLKGRKLSEETKQKIRNKILNRIEKGLHKGWSKRNKPSYPEIFFMKVLENNNINYEYEKPFGKYFIDFAINDKMIALEIDGKQHELEERAKSDTKKDNFLRENNWFVYRIKWVSINNEIGKNQINKEIDKFIEFYNNKETIIS